MMADCERTVPLSASRETRRPSLRLFAAVLAIKLLVLLCGYVAVAGIGMKGLSIPPPESESPLVDLPARWDTGWYVGLASGGYRWSPETQRFQNVAFFPAWPLTLRAAAWTLRVPRTSAAWAWVGVGLAFALHLCGLYVLWRLVAETYTREIADATLLLAVSYPFAIFFCLPYTESLFLLAAVGAFFGAARRRWALCAAFGLVAGLTRPNGLFLSASLGLVCLGWRVLQAGRATPIAGWRAWGAASAPAVGTALYSTYVWRLTGHPLAWMTAQDTWGRTFRTPITLVGEVVGRMQAEGVLGYVGRYPYDALNLAALIGALALLWLVTRTLGLPSAAFVALNTVLPVMAGGLPSMGRYTAVLFPVAVVLAVRTPQPSLTALCAAGAMVQGLVAALFFTWRPVF